VDRAAWPTRPITKQSDGYFRFQCPACGELRATVNPRNNLAHCFCCGQNFNNIDLLMIRRLRLRPGCRKFCSIGCGSTRKIEAVRNRRAGRSSFFRTDPHAIVRPPIRPPDQTAVAVRSFSRVLNNSATAPSQGPEIRAVTIRSKMRHQFGR
jgi:hypothetical protein